MKKILIFSIILLIIVALFVAIFSQKNGEVIDNSEEELIECLADAGVVIYGSKTCPACLSLVNSFGGYEKIESIIYIECSKDQERCMSEMKGNYVPEIQIQGEIYTGSRNPNDIAKEVNCKI